MQKTSKKGLWITLVVIAVIVAAILWIINTVNGNKIDKVLLSKAPNKTTYALNENAEYEGIWLQVVKRNGSFDIVEDTSLMTFSGFDSSKANDKLTVTVSYEGFDTTFFVKIEEPAKPTPKLSRIYLEKLPNKLTYTLSESLDVTGAVLVREFSDGSLVRVNLRAKDITGFVAAKQAGAGVHPLTVTYEEPSTGIVKTTTFDITITE